MSVGGYLWVVRVVAGELEVDPGLLKWQKWRGAAAGGCGCDVDDGEGDDKPLDG